jgi:hypothetical protein
MGIHHIHSYSELFFLSAALASKMLLSLKMMIKITDWVELQGHVDCPSNFDEFLNVDQLIPTTKDHTATSLTSLDVPDSEHVAYDQEEEGEGLPARPTRKDAFTALSVLDTVISTSDC